MNICVIGTGYVGIVTTVVFADFGNQVWGLDVDEKKIERIKKGIPPIHEPGLTEYLKKGLKSGRLQFTSDYKQALKDVEAVFICVGTPQSETGDVDTKYVEAAIESVAKNMNKPLTIVLKSTVPPGIHKKLKMILDKYTKIEYEFASCPEFLREGSAIADTLHPARVVIGADTKKAKEKLLELHKPLAGERVITDIISAQMIKYAANSMLATKISFANAIARICDLLGADVVAVMKGIGLDPRIGIQFLNAGLGYGGSCFPKDVKGLYHLSENAGYKFKLLEEVDQINNTQVAYILDKARKKIASFKGKKVGLLGLAFKPDTDDMRDARALVLIKALLEDGVKVKAYDPVAVETTKMVVGDKITYIKNAYDLAEGADVLILVTEWNEFKELDMERIKKLMKGKLFIDGRNMYDPQEMKKLGFEYVGVGRD